MTAASAVHGVVRGGVSPAARIQAIDIESGDSIYAQGTNAWVQVTNAWVDRIPWVKVHLVYPGL